MDAIQTEDVQHLKRALGQCAERTAHNVLAVLSVMLRTAFEWGVIETAPGSIKMLPTTKTATSFHDFEEDERLAEAGRSD